jgi:hypothetical protein
MIRYMTTHGQPTTADDPLREVWYSAQCCYWTDDWSKLKKFGSGIPCCPQCGSPGMQTMFQHWDKGVQEVDAREKGYALFLQDVKEKCYGRGNGIGMLWKMTKLSGNSEMDKALGDAVKELIEKHSKDQQ